MANLSYIEIKNFTLQVLKGRWFMVFASLLIMSVNGTSYMFGLYSGDIKSTLGYDQTTLDILSFYKDLGGNLGIVAGLAYEVIPPWMVLLNGSIMNFAGYFLVWEAVSGGIGRPSVWQMCLYICLATHAASYPNTGALVTSVSNFPESRGSVIGLLKGMIGLSGAIMTQLYHAFYGNDSRALILLLAWFPAIVPLLFLPTIRVVKLARRAKEIKVYYNFLHIALGLAGFIMVMIILQNRIKFIRIEYIGSAVFVFLILLLPSAIVINEEFKLWQAKKNASQIEFDAEPKPPWENPNAADPPMQPEHKKLDLRSCFKNIFNKPNRGENYMIPQAILSIDMLIIFISTTCGVGGALAAIDNLGQIADSLGYKHHKIAAFISLISIWNFLGRVLVSFASETLLTKHEIPRTLILTITILLACLGHVLIAIGVPNSLYFSSMIIGFSLGAQLPLVSTIISEIFGLKHFSTLYSVGSVSSPVGSYIFNVKVAGRLYDREAKRQMEVLGVMRKAGEELKCNGVHCFRTAFVVITMATFVGFLVSIGLVIRTREFYKSDIYKRYGEGTEKGDIETENKETNVNL